MNLKIKSELYGKNREDYDSYYISLFIIINLC